ncbi:beta-N-acetylhexosaminidase [Enterovirga rhinocerotis]|uniref:beta-N-acetylhexosaminidase n=1 Tax=Enterovirga rhinocerotis TaxID=1339210 RepID=A0A4R7C8E7_9HYPH|nr:beta-N-acetylhexosaminidase [Enterovirga rhinocerotis]TDR94718.1 beta-N-acetylhexosaminidase [Enterovirga rhinocerotis]
MRAFVAGCSGPDLTAEERAFFREADPFGFILFRRNVVSPEQVRALTASLREAVGRADAPILIDQEGGRVQRLGPPHWPRYPAGRTYGALGADAIEARDAAFLGARLMAHDLRELGITVDCVPVLDVPVPGAHDVIGDRAYGEDPETVTALGGGAAEGLLAGGVLPVVKHIPGHGRAGADSHLALPRVSASLDDLRARDFVPFKALAHLPAAMTAHVVYEAIDPDAPGTTSRRVVQDVIRGEIGFDGLLFTDDLSMKALAGPFRTRMEAAIAAGCDIGLHCNGDLAEARAVADGAPLLAGRALERAEAALALIAAGPAEFDPVDARLAFETRLGAIA